MAEPEEKFLGIDKEILERFLTLVRDKYPLADKANYLLETKERQSGINIGIANQRDVLSHLVTLLKNPDWSRQDQLGQLYHAEEHLRRAVMESYETALNRRLQKINDIMPHYREKILPKLGNPHRNPRLSSALDNDQIQTTMQCIEQHKMEGRAAKRENMWNTTWERGVSSFIEAHTLAEKLHRDLEETIIRVDAMESKNYSKYGYVVGVLGIIFGILFAVLG